MDVIVVGEIVDMILVLVEVMKDLLCDEVVLVVCCEKIIVISKVC